MIDHRDGEISARYRALSDDVPPASLDAATANLAAHFKSQPETNLADAVFTLQVGRAGFSRLQRSLQAFDPPHQRFGRVRLRRCHAPYRARPRRIIGTPHDVVHMQLRHHVAKRCHIEVGGD